MLELPNFDELVTLAQENPDALEALRQEHIDAIINSANSDNQQRLRGLQFQIDAQRQIHKSSPMGSCMKISQLMHECFAELRGHLNQISGANDPLREFSRAIEAEVDKTTTPANVLAFPSR